ncbi:MAG: mannose-1-phosphate guanylyltransferase [Candidatus Shapirobacteria bacterium]
MASISNHYILILCGGSGPRLWPLSRADHPKQFLHLNSQNSLLKETFLRAQKIVNRDHVFLISNNNYQKTIIQNLSGLILPENLILEPDKKNTAMAILYASFVIGQINPKAVITTFASDHFIDKLKNFSNDILLSADLANTHKSILTIGIKPTYPSPSYGYLLTKPTTFKYRQVTKFTEKPDQKIAQNFIKNHNYYWNSGIYTFTVTTLINEFKLHSPKYFDLFNQLQKNPKNIKKSYSLSPNLAIDIAISEKSKNLLLVPATFDWSDIGEWKSIFQLLPKTENDFASLNKNQPMLSINSNSCLISGNSKKLIGLIGIQNIGIIDTKDALLLVNLSGNDSFLVRDLVGQIVKNPKLKNYFLKSHE